MDKRYFSKKVAEWYGQHKRNLPWRETKDPYRIWLSEIILQQTRVSQGLPYYQKFTEAFPTVFDLAAAPEQKVLRLWQGLGYYTRARNLHKCAREIVAQHNGVFPNRFEELRKLSGIGDYTAAAIASICFNERVAVVDGNVFRVLARVFSIHTPINSTEGKKIFSELANKLIPAHEPDVHNQAVMEFGAMHCTPQNPGCDTCVLKSGCVAHQHSLQQELPVKQSIKKIRKRYFYYVVFQKGRSLLMKKRAEKDIWHGLYDFYLIEKKRPMHIDKVIREDVWINKLNGTLGDRSRIYKHVLSHQIIYSTFIRIHIKKTSVVNGSGLKLCSLKTVIDLPKPVLINKFLSDHDFL